jgi:hypothetical protein
MPPELIVAGVGISVIVPAVVELLKQLGLPVRFAGVAAVAVAAIVLGLVQLRADAIYGGLAAWALLSLVYGLAAAGMYSQAKAARRRGGEAASE